MSPHRLLTAFPLALLLAGCLAAVPANPSVADGSMPTPDAAWTPVKVEACAIAGGHDRIILAQEFGPEPRCVVVGLVDSSWAKTFDLTLPSGWGIETATLYRSTCAAAKDQAESQRAASGTGAIAIDWGTLWIVSIHADFEFPASGTLPAERAHLEADAVPLKGTCP